MSDGELRPAQLAAAWTAEVEWRHGTDAARFCAVARRADGTGAHPVAESAPVAWPPAGPTGVEALTTAHRELVAALAGAGWEPLPPGEAWYATRFGWEPLAPAPQPAPHAPAPQPPAELFAPAPPWPDDSKQLWRCEIKWDAGWIDSRFQAVGYRPGARRGRAIGASAPIKGLLMGQPQADRPEHRGAFHDLAWALETAGWEPAGRGSDWYSERFWWRREDDPRGRLAPAASDAEAART